MDLLWGIAGVVVGGCAGLVVTALVASSATSEAAAEREAAEEARRCLREARNWLDGEVPDTDRAYQSVTQAIAALGDDL